MRISIIAVGRARRGPEQEIFASYCKRITWPLELVEVEEKRPLPPAQRLMREENLIRDKIPSNAVLVALDETGEDLGSRKFATLFQQWEDRGTRDITFLIGGADGLPDPLKSQAHYRIRFGRMTWPHMLVRPMIAEQIYRAGQILQGHPYHRD